MTLTRVLRREVRRGNAFLAPQPPDALVLADPPKPRAHPEQALQRQVAEYLAWALAPPWWFTAIGHGGGGTTRGRILKGMGVKRGVLDLLVMGPERFMLWMELKAPKGRLTPEQKAFGEMVRSFGHYHTVVRSLDEARDELLALEVPLRETKASITRTMASAIDAEGVT